MLLWVSPTVDLNPDGKLARRNAIVRQNLDQPRLRNLGIGGAAEGEFVLAVFGWGLGLYSPPVYLHAVRESCSRSRTACRSRSKVVSRLMLTGSPRVSTGRSSWPGAA